MATLIGVILRQATIIAPEVPMTNILLALAEAARDFSKDLSVKRKIISAMGEGLFFTATQVSQMTYLVPED